MLACLEIETGRGRHPSAGFKFQGYDFASGAAASRVGKGAHAVNILQTPRAESAPCPREQD